MEIIFADKRIVPFILFANVGISIRLIVGLSANSVTKAFLCLCLSLFLFDDDEYKCLLNLDIDPNSLCVNFRRNGINLLCTLNIYFNGQFSELNKYLL